jgi:hypothetical protein
MTTGGGSRPSLFAAFDCAGPCPRIGAAFSFRNTDQ